MTHLDELVIEGGYLTAPGQVLISDIVAENLDIRVGERVVILAIGAEGAESKAFTVAGLFQAPSSDLEQTAMASLDDVQAMSGFVGATSIAVSLPREASDSRAVAEARELLAGHTGIVVADYYDLNPFARFMVAGATIKMIPFVVMISLMAPCRAGISARPTARASRALGASVQIAKTR